MQHSCAECTDICAGRTDNISGVVALHKLCAPQHKLYSADSRARRSGNISCARQTGLNSELVANLREVELRGLLSTLESLYTTQFGDCLLAC